MERRCVRFALAGGGEAVLIPLLGLRLSPYLQNVHQHDSFMVGRGEVKWLYFICVVVVWLLRKDKGFKVSRGVPTPPPPPRVPASCLWTREEKLEEDTPLLEYVSPGVTS